MFFILYGENDFSIKESLAKIREESGGVELGKTNVIVLDGEKVTPDKLTVVCNTIPFLAPKRLVIVEGLLGRFEASGKGQGGQGRSTVLGEWEALVNCAANMPESTVLVLIDGRLSKGNPLLRKLAPHAEVRECVALQRANLRSWIISRVTSQGGEISFPASRLLADLIGNKLWILSNEIDKLCTYAGKRRIEETDIHLLVSYARESSVFEMVDAIVQHRLKVALRLLRQILNEGAAPPYLLFMITRQFRLMIQAKSLMAQRMPVKSIGVKVGLSSEFALEKTLGQARGYPMRRLEEIYHKLLETDISIKTGRLDEELALGLLINDLCG